MKRDNKCPIQRYLDARSHPIIGPSLRPRSGAIAGRMVKSVGIVFSGALMRTVVVLGSTAVLARLLTPQDFGHVAMAMVITEFAALFSNFGVVSILVQKDHLSRTLLETSLWFSGALGVLLGVVVFGSSYAVSAIYGDPVVGHVVRALSPMFVLDELTVVPVALLMRNMRFREDTVIQNTMIIVRGTVAILLAWRGFGVDALIVATLVGRVVSLMLLWSYVPLVPRFRLRVPHVMRNLKLGSGYFAGGLLYYANSSLDRAIIGYRIGAVAVGYYQAARSLGDQLRDRITAPLQRVLLPAYSALQGDLSTLRDTSQRVTAIMAMILMPIGFGIAATSSEFVAILYGPRWRDMIPVLRYIAIAASIRGALAANSTIYQALDRVGLSVRVGLVNTAVLVIAVLIGCNWGIVGAAQAVLAASCIAVALSGTIAFRLVDLSISDLARSLMPAVLAASIMLLAVDQVAAELAPGMPAFAKLGIEVAVGISIYAIAAVIVMPARIVEALRLARKMIS